MLERVTEILVIILTLFLSLCSGYYSWIHGFQIGRILEGLFEYEELNGYYRPEEAVEICREDPECAGFTYRGILPGLNHGSPKIYETFFFRFVLEVVHIPLFFNWVSYCSYKNFARISGIPSNASIHNTSLSVYNLRDCTMNDDCAGILLDKNENVVKAFSYIDMDTVNRTSEGVTLINLVADPMSVGQSSKYDPAGFNPCCSPVNNSKIKASEFLNTVKDGLERIDCNSITRKDFEERYIIPRIAVMLVNCTKDWEAQKSWSIESLLNRYPQTSNKMWTTSYRFVGANANEEKNRKFREWFNSEGEMELYENEEENLSAQMYGQDILELINSRNVTFRIFEKIGIPESWGFHDTKTDLFKDWSIPKPMPKDLFADSMKTISDYKWIIMGSAGTGTKTHRDPDLTDAWNSLLYGHKYWVLFPNDVAFDQFECDATCSPDFDDMYSSPWYTQILPQIRNKKFYGQGVIETIQGPGETIYVPHNMPHAVLNLDENLSVTENFMSKRALDELAKYFALDWNPLPYHSFEKMAVGWNNLMNTLVKDDRGVLRDVYQQVESHIFYENDKCYE